MKKKQKSYPNTYPSKRIIMLCRYTQSRLAAADRCRSVIDQFIRNRVLTVLTQYTNIAVTVII